VNFLVVHNLKQCANLSKKIFVYALTFLEILVCEIIHYNPVISRRNCRLERTIWRKASGDCSVCEYRLLWYKVGTDKTKPLRGTGFRV
jgi:hypothetical protein